LEGEPLAINKPFDYVYASPIKISNKSDTAQKLAEILNLNANDIEKKINGNGLYVFIKDKITDQETNKINEAKLPGIYLDKKIMRYYPQGNVASQLVGFVDEDGAGRYGLEEYYDDYLSQGKI